MGKTNEMEKYLISDDIESVSSLDNSFYVIETYQDKISTLTTKLRRYYCLILFLVLFFGLVFTRIPKNKFVPENDIPSNNTIYQCKFIDGEIFKSSQVGNSFISLCWKNVEKSIRGDVDFPYTVELIDPWSFQKPKEYKVVYSGRALSLNITDLLPSTTYKFRLISSKSRVLSSTEAKTLTISNSCGNENDVQSLHKYRKTAKSDIQHCLMYNALSENSPKKCISEKTKLTSTCSECFIQQGHCILNKCTTQCIFPSSSSCKSCAERECFDILVKCSRVPRWAFPP